MSTTQTGQETDLPLSPINPRQEYHLARQQHLNPLTPVLDFPPENWKLIHLNCFKMFCPVVETIEKQTPGWGKRTSVNHSAEISLDRCQATPPFSPPQPGPPPSSFLAANSWHSQPPMVLLSRCSQAILPASNSVPEGVFSTKPLPASPSGQSLQMPRLSWCMW